MVITRTYKCIEFSQYGFSTTHKHYLKKSYIAISKLVTKWQFLVSCSSILTVTSLLIIIHIIIIIIIIIIKLFNYINITIESEHSHVQYHVKEVEVKGSYKKQIKTSNKQDYHWKKSSYHCFRRYWLNNKTLSRATKII